MSHCDNSQTHNSTKYITKGLAIFRHSNEEMLRVIYYLLKSDGYREFPQRNGMGRGEGVVFKLFEWCPAGFKCWCFGP